MVKLNKSAGVVVYYFDSKPYFLLLKYKTYWGFAKGLVEPGEKEQQAAVREVKEEANLDVKIIPGFEFKQAWFFRQDGELIRKEAIFFIARINKKDSEKTKVSFEHEDFAWRTYEEALKLIKIKQNKEMLASADKFIIEFEKQKRLI